MVEPHPQAHARSAPWHHRWQGWWAHLLRTLEQHPPPPGGPFFC